MSCNQCTMDHNGNKLNDFSFTFCVIHGADNVTFCLHFMGMFYMTGLYDVLTFVHFMCV